MARELGMNPAKLGKIDNHHQEAWKAPLPEFIESLYEKSFGRSRPVNVLSIEDLSRERMRKQQARREAKEQRRATRDAQPMAPPRDQIGGPGDRLANLEHGAVVVDGPGKRRKKSRPMRASMPQDSSNRETRISRSGNV